MPRRTEQRRIGLIFVTVLTLCCVSAITSPQWLPVVVLQTDGKTVLDRSRTVCLAHVIAVDDTGDRPFAQIECSGPAELSVRGNSSYSGGNRRMAIRSWTARGQFPSAAARHLPRG